MADEKARHDYRDTGRGYRLCHGCGVSPFDARWEFIVTWDPIKVLPLPVARLFMRSDVVDRAQGRAVHRTGEGHATFYVRAVNAYLAKHAPDRQDDVVATAQELPCARTLSPERSTDD